MNTGHAHTHGHSVHRHASSHSHGSHAHSAHGHAPSSLRALGWVFSLTFVIFLAQVVGGWVSHSLALISDAAHMLSDSTGLLLAFIAILIGRKSATRRATFGYRRVEVFAAMINAAAIIAISGWILFRAFQRLDGHQPVDTGVMLLVAVIGLLANAGSALILLRQEKDSLNMRGAFLHVLSDLLGSCLLYTSPSPRD